MSFSKLKKLVDFAEDQRGNPYQRRMAEERAEHLARKLGIDLEKFKEENGAHEITMVGRMTTEFKNAAVLVNAILNVDVFAQEKFGRVRARFVGPKRFQAAEAYQMIVRLQKDSWEELFKRKKFLWKCGLEPVVHRRSFMSGIFNGIIYQFNEAEAERHVLQLQQAKMEEVTRKNEPFEHNPFALIHIPRPKPKVDIKELVEEMKQAAEPGPVRVGPTGPVPPQGDQGMNEDLNHPPNNPDEYSHILGFRIGYLTDYGFFKRAENAKGRRKRNSR